MRVSEFSGCERLLPTARVLFGDARTQILRSPEWWLHFQRYGVAAGDILRIFVASADEARPVALVPAVFSRLSRAHPGARLLHFLGPEGMPYEPMLAPDCEDAREVVDGVIAFVTGARLQYDVLRFSPLRPDSPLLDHLVGCLRKNRYKVQLYQMQDDRYEITAGHSSADYLATRPVALRERLATAGRALFDSGRALFMLVREPSEVERAWRQCEGILSDADQRHPEHFDYLPGLMRVAADAGILRLGLIALDGEPAAMQMWIIADNVAQCLRISQSKRFADLPLDEMVTERITAHLIDVDRVVELDFGYIVEQFAAQWAPRTRQRFGIVAFNPRTRRGFRGSLRHIVLPRLLAFPRRVLRKLRGRR